LLQWATGGMLFCWFTTRRRIASIGYGWLLRGVYFCFAAGSLAAGLAFGVVPLREAASVGVMAGCLLALVVSIQRRTAGVSGAAAEHDRRTERVAAMTGIERTVDAPDAEAREAAGPEFPPVLDLVPVAFGVVGLLAAAVDAGGDTWVAIARTLVGAAFIGALSDAMLLGHWYLTQPGLPRVLLNELVGVLAWLWPLQVLVMLLPTGMIAVLTGEVDDGWGGMLGWMWLACSITTIVLIFVTKAALRERYYSAVMAATGLLYLAILTGFGMDVVPRAILANA
ncbi:MAG TPA: hypothetical protein VK860_02510, partial [Ilumatobacteraceae bacterium]|nr:hypothetical protein [Ilumatobacteraceae bacterium]